MKDFLNLKKITNLMVGGCFVLFIWLPLFDNAFHLAPKMTSTENRKLAPFPKFKIQDFFNASFFKNFEKFYDDHFGFRYYLIRLNSLINLCWTKNIAISKIITGKDGWIFYAGEGVISDYRCVKSFSKLKLLQMRRTLEKQRNWLAKRNIKFLVVFVPNKHTIYSEFLPDTIKKAGDESRLDQFTAYLKVNSDIQFLDLRDSLLQAKPKQRLYHRTDSHWNDFGAFIAYQQIMHKLTLMLPNLNMRSLSEFKVKDEVVDGMDLAKVLALSDKFKEGKITITPITDNSKEISDPIFLKLGAQASKTDKEQAPKALLVGDSFSENLWPILKGDFSQFVFVKWLGGFLKKELIEYEKPDVVVLQIVERYLGQL